MSEMIDRIRKELHERGGWDTPWETCTQCEDATRAVLNLLREPTPDMLAAGFKTSPHDVGGCRDQITEDSEWMAEVVLAPYQAMVDEALKQSPAATSQPPHE